MRKLFDRTSNTIFLDMDGVLADFDKLVIEIFGAPFGHERSDEEEKQMWGELMKVDRLYLQLDLMPTARELWEKAHSYGAKVEVLTAIPRKATMPSAEVDKREWIAKHFGEATTVRIGPYSRDKWRHAKRADILVDDRQSNITDWINRGEGIGIFYDDFARVINVLDREVTGK